MTCRFFFLLGIAVCALGCATAASEYQKAAKNGTIEAYEQFVKENPGDNNVADARERIRELSTEKSFHEAEQRNTREAYATFAKNFPDSALAAKASYRINEPDGEAFRRSCAIGTANSFAGFIHDYPDSPRKNLVSARIDFLKAVSSGKIEDYRRFLETANDNIFAPEAAAEFPSLWLEMLHKKFGLKSVGLPEGSVNSTVGTTGASAEPSAPDLWTHYDSVRKDLMRIGLDAPVMTKGEFSKGTDAPFVISVETKKSIERVSTAVQVLFGVTSSALIAVGSGGTMYGWIIPKQYQKETHSLTITDRKTDTVYYSDLESLDSRAAKDHAARAAGELGAVAIPMLTFALCNESSSVRQASAEALLRIGGPVTRDLLVESLKSETDIFTARKVFEVLERLNDARGRETIIANLSARNPEIRAAALILIGETRRIDAIGKVLEALKDADERVRIAAHETLKTFAEPSVAENSSEPSDNTVNRISSMYPESAGAIPAIVSALRHDSPEVRAGAADVLGDVGDSGSVVHLMRSLSDSDPRVRSAAASALGRIKDPRAVGPLAKLSQDDADDGVRNSAKDALEWMDVKVGESDTIFQSPGESIPTDQLHRTAVGGADNDKKETPGIVPEDKGGGSPSKEPKNGEERELISEYVRMGEVFLAGGDYARAIDVYSRILNIDEGNRDALEGIRRANDARSAEELERNKLESSQIPERRKENPRAN